MALIGLKPYPYAWWHYSRVAYTCLPQLACSVSVLEKAFCFLSIIPINNQLRHSTEPGNKQHLGSQIAFQWLDSAFIQWNYFSTVKNNNVAVLFYLLFLQPLIRNKMKITWAPCILLTFPVSCLKLVQMFACTRLLKIQLMKHLSFIYVSSHSGSLPTLSYESEFLIL